MKPHLKWDGEFWSVTNWMTCDLELYDAADTFCDDMIDTGKQPYNTRDAQ